VTTFFKHGKSTLNVASLFLQQIDGGGVCWMAIVEVSFHQKNVHFKKHCLKDCLSESCQKLS